MNSFTIYSQTTAPAASKPLLETVQGKFGMIPNLLASMAEAPSVLQGYMELSAACSSGSLSPIELQIVQITVSRMNGCEYCVAAHSTIADMQKMPADIISCIREDKPLMDAKMEALRTFTKAMVQKQGWASDSDMQAFITAGYSKAQVLEVCMSIALKTFSNYANHVIGTPVDAAFQARAISLTTMKKAS